MIQLLSLSGIDRINPHGNVCNIILSKYICVGSNSIGLFFCQWCCDSLSGFSSH